MDPTAPGEMAAHLSWLWPDAASLVALTQPLTAATWPVLRRDPATMLLLFGHGASAGHDPDCPFFSVLRCASLWGLRTVLTALDEGSGIWADWRQPERLPVYRCALGMAHAARLVAGQAGRCDPALAWAAGLLAPLGWLALAATDPAAAARCLSDPGSATEPLVAQEAYWGLNHAEVARRLARRWLLPDWLRVPVGHLNLPLPIAVEMGAEASLFATVQLAATLVEEQHGSLGLSVGVDGGPAQAWLGLTAGDLNTLRRRLDDVDLSDDLSEERQDPRGLPHLPRRIRAAIEQSHQRGEVNRSLERDVDRLHRLLVARRSAVEERVQGEKLAALAEFAAGASHEINNPLAVISGQCQYLLQFESDEKRQNALRSIGRQVQRIHGLLTDLMQFARPGRPNKQPQSLGLLLQSVVDELRPAADERGVTLEYLGPEEGRLVIADGRQVATAIGCLVRNAIQAASTGGWARISLQRPRDGTIEVVVEDNGPGPMGIQRQHMFDPFYSGRSAGRGQGLGLPTAWRLARENGGDVRFAPLPGGPTRFVLSLPELPAVGVPDRLSA